MTRVVAVEGVLAPHRYPQRQITDALARICLPDPQRRALLDQVHVRSRVTTRNLALPLERYAELASFTDANDAFLEVAVELGAQALTAAVKSAGLTPSDVDLVLSTTVTGIAVPSLDARIAGLVGLRPDVKRVPVMGLGCVAGAAGIARLHDYLLGHPGEVAALVAVELCSLTLQRADASVANLVASGLFGDGAGAVIAVGADRAEPDGPAWAGPTVVDSRSHLYPDTARAMGWDVGDSGLKVVLGVEVPALVEQYLADDVHGLLADHGLTLDDVAVWVSHPGGPKVIEAIEAALGLHGGELDVTWRSLERIGNLSSASVLHVLADTLAERAPQPGDVGVLMAMGPGFCSEVVLLRW